MVAFAAAGSQEKVFRATPKGVRFDAVWYASYACGCLAGCCCRPMFAISVAIYRGAKCPTAGKQPKKVPSGSRSNSRNTRKTVKTVIFRMFRLFFGCLTGTHSAPFGTSVDGHRDCKPMLICWVRVASGEQYSKNPHHKMGLPWCSCQWPEMGQKWIFGV